MYADDLKICAVSNPRALKTALVFLEKWSADLGLPISEPKTLVMHVVRSNLKVDFELNGTLIAKTELVKDLGLTYDNTLSFLPHIKLCRSKATRTCKLIHRVFRCTSVKVRWRLFAAYVRSVLEYASVVWSFKAAPDCQLLESVQVKFLKFTFARLVDFRPLSLYWVCRLSSGIFNRPFLES
ncbi:hypothetical protein L596_017302 [Steinernema carpocapsae]|uniref:Reverse transcriptase domain-containing protein n=1 Tax=Steinernema carpocapsae TaxID=34508 RepID=A0A4U5N182_STECR|nr:hypothetical protein L596_017302 [Steinernema carpocapsae]